MKSLPGLPLQAFFFLFPHRCRGRIGSSRRLGLHLPGEHGIGDALADSGFRSLQEAPAVVVLVLSLVEAEGLLVEVAEEMKGLDAHIGSIDGALQKAPEVLDAVGVNVAANVGLCVVDDLVFEFLPELSVGPERIGETSAPGSTFFRTSGTSW